MPMYFRLSSTPELRDLSRVQRDELIETYSDYTGRSLVSPGLYWAGTPLLVLLVSPCVCCSIGQPAYGVVCILMVALFVTAAVWSIHYDRQNLRRFLIRHGNPRRMSTCDRCGYDLCHTESTNCPECGANVIYPAVRPEQTRPGDLG
ncbi:MAG: hypothetical protein AAF593_01655 [Planctomycetota bacterium]